MHFDDDFFKELLEMFRMESSEHLNTMKNGLPVLRESGSADWSNVIEEVFRAAHSLKGAARTVGLEDIEPVGLQLEKIFGLLKTNMYSITFETENLFKDVLAGLEAVISTINDSGKVEGDTVVMIRKLDEINNMLCGQM